MTGTHVGPHSGDLVRLPLVYLYGGVWMDVGTFLFKSLDTLLESTPQGPTTGWDGPEFFENKALILDGVRDVYWAQILTNWDGRKQFELLSTFREGASPDDEQYQEADAFVKSVLEMCSILKASHGLFVHGREYLATIWGQPENCDADRKPGTFAAYLRWASEHFEQSREVPLTTMTIVKDALLVGGITDGIGETHPDRALDL
ncbi:hypothetical protein CISG_02336 [Coccidioides immitis RMSCC 3703]|uniref:Capsule polysaccharide biosynthesis protein n=1 Tax=Coccidioides immitis RMSCC 3703 TaxID=454286 RepID=A0A0J8R7T2_COCIT|nr:hypothetical protein CISG_02336 [Coccidioides immitis RMSCC 3703]